MIEICHRKSRRVLRRVDADTLAGANLSGARLWDADLSGQDLRGANLAGARLMRADLRGANFQGAELRYANLSEADLRGANLGGARLREARLDQALYDAATRGLNPFLAFWEACVKVTGPGELAPAEAAEGRGDEVSSVG
jgi:uncharacterized protein YjbI with pentapeptide repeats